MIQVSWQKGEGSKVKVAPFDGWHHQKMRTNKSKSEIFSLRSERGLTTDGQSFFYWKPTPLSFLPWFSSLWYVFCSFRVKSSKYQSCWALGSNIKVQVLKSKNFILRFGNFWLQFKIFDAKNELFHARILYPGQNNFRAEKTAEFGIDFVLLRF